jgi:hypothetical protein
MGGHPTSCFSAVEILTLLYHGGILMVRPKEPDWPDRDRFILSKSNAAPALYSVLARAGFFPVGLAPRAKMTKPVRKGALITWDDVLLDEASAVVKLRRQQNEL